MSHNSSRPRREACCGCRFWLSDSPKKPIDVDDTDFGVCRRRPPRIIENLARLNVDARRMGTEPELAWPTMANYDSTSFPSTFGTEWCGEFEWLPNFAPVELPL